MKRMRNAIATLSAIAVTIIFSAVSFAQEKTIYIDAKGGAVDRYATLRDALEAVHNLSKPKPAVTIIISANTTEDRSVTINEGEDVTIVTTGNRQSINFKNTISDFRCIGVKGKLNIGGNGFPIIRATESGNSRNFLDEDSKVLIKVNATGVLNINNAELAYGSNVIWLSEAGAAATFNNGIIHSATEQCVNITHGTFTMKGGYICGHYRWKSGGSHIDITDNPIMNYDSFNGKLAGEVPDQDEISKLIQGCYDLSGDDWLKNANTSGGVYLRNNDSTFNMEGGSISGIICPGKHKVITEWNGTKVVYSTSTYMLTAVVAHQGTVNISGGKIFGNYSSSDGAALLLSYPNYAAVPGRYDMAVGNISGDALLAYNVSNDNGGAVRVEKATTFNLNGGKIAYNEAGKGGGGIRVVSSRFTMSGKAEICYNHSLLANVEKYNGGGIGAVYQKDYGDTKTIVELKGGKIHHNVAEGNGGGVTVTDKGNEGENAGIEATFAGVEIYENTSNDSGGGVYIGGGASITLDNGTKLYGNTAQNNGGGFYLGAINGHTGSLTTKTCEIYDNEVISGNGGGIYTEYSPVTIQEGTKIYSHDIDGSGAGVFLGTASSYTQKGGNIYQNHAGQSGGAVAIIDGECNILGGSVYENTTDANGAGVYVHLDSKEKSVNLSGAVFSNNGAQNGGAFYIDGGSCAISAGTIFRNTASNQGGGIFVAEGDVTISGGTITGNQSDYDGGAFYLKKGDATIVDGNIGSEESPNIAKDGNGGAIFVGNGTITLEGGVLLANKAKGSGNGNGGALYVAQGSVNINGSTVRSNIADNNGGGIYIKSGNLNMEQGSLIENKANEMGGAVFMAGQGDVTFTNGTLKSNEALNGGGIYLSSGASMTFKDGLIAENKAKVGTKTSAFTTAYAGGDDTLIGCGGGIYLQSGTSDKNTSLEIKVVDRFGLYGNEADRAGDDIVAEGVNTSVTVPNVTAMDLKDFEGAYAQPNWYEDYVYVQDGSDSGYAEHSILKYPEGSGKRFKQMLVDGTGESYNHLVTFTETSKTYPSYVCLSLGYIVISAIIQATGLKEKENMYFTLEQLVKPDGASEWTVKNTYPVLVKGTGDESVQRTVRNLMPGQYRVKQFKSGATPWAWAYTVAPEVIEKLVTKEDGDNNLFPFTVKHVEDETNVLHDEEIKVNSMVDNAAIVPNIGVEDYKKKNDVHVKF